MLMAASSSSSPACCCIWKSLRQAISHRLCSTRSGGAATASTWSCSRRRSRFRGGAPLIFTATSRVTNPLVRVDSCV